MEAGGGRPRSELRRNDVTARRGLPVLSWILSDHSRRVGEPARGAPEAAVGSRQRSSISKVSIPTRAAAGSRTQSFAVVTRSAPARSASRRSRDKFSRTEPVMIGKRTRHDDLGPDPPQAGEKLGWTADPGECRHAHAAEPGCVYRLEDRPARPAVPPCAPLPAVRRRRSGRSASRPRQAGPDRFAQWSGRNHAAIAESVFGVDDDERQVLRDPRVLKPVVEHDDFGAGRRCFAASGGPVARDPARPAFAPAATPRRRPPRHRAGSDRRAPVRRAARHSRASRHAPRRRFRQ